jgi:hypothetical protein
VRSWEISVEELMAFKDELKAAAIATEQPNAPLVAGDHCGSYCPNAGGCPALRAKAYDFAVATFSDANDDSTIRLTPPGQLTPVQLTNILKAADILDNWLRSVEEFALAQATRGNVPEGFKLVEKGTHRRWQDAAEVERVFKAEFGERIYTPRKVISPAQLEKVVGKARYKDLEPFITKPKGDATLAPLVDKRPPITSVFDAFVPDKIAG